MADNAPPRAPRLIVVPLLLGIVGAVALLIFAELGYQRLESAAQRVAGALELQSALYETQSLVVDAETGQRGFLLTGREEYLVPYRDALPKIAALAMDNMWVRANPRRIEGPADVMEILDAAY